MLDMQGCRKKLRSADQVCDFSKLSLHTQKTRVFL